MVKVLLRLWSTFNVSLFELGGAGAIVFGAHELGGPGAAWVTAGVGLLAKSLELDIVKTAKRQ